MTTDSATMSTSETGDIWFDNLYYNQQTLIFLGICLLTLVFYIGFERMTGDTNGGSSVTIGVEKHDRVKISNPLFLHLKNENGTLNEGLKAVVSSLCPCDVVLLWGPKINPLHDLILKKGKDLRKASKDLSNPLYTQLDCLHTEKLTYLEKGEHLLCVPCPESVSVDSLGDMPRQRYPLVAITFVTEDLRCSQDDRDTSYLASSYPSNEEANTIVGLISIIHLSDDVVTLKSQVVKQYIKTASIPVYSLQPLYMSHKSEEAETPQRADKQEEDAGDIFNESTSYLCSETASPLSSESTSKIGNVQKTILSTNTLPNEKSDCCDSPVSKQNDIHQECSKNTEVNTEKDVILRHRTDRNTNRLKINHLVSGSTAQSLNDDLKQKKTLDPTSDMCVDPLSECVVCQNRPAACVILPCRHACVCLGCFKLLDKCPLCRSDIDLYFLLTDNETHDSSSGEELMEELHREAVRTSIGEMWERFNNRINHLVGYR